MKKHFLFAGLLAFATIIFAGCSNIANSISAGKSTAAGTRYITINATSGTDKDGNPYTIFADKSDSRSILPAALDASDLTYFIFGTDTVKKTEFAPEEITFTQKGTSTTEGTVTRVFNKSAYTLTLVALTSDNITALSTNRDKSNLLKYAALIGDSEVDFRYNETVSFYLTPNSTSTANGGNVALKIYAAGWNPADADYANYKISKLGIYNASDASTGTLNTSSGALVLNSSVSTLPTNAPENANLSLISTIPAGIYDFVIGFSDAYGHYNEYSEDITVLNNQTTAAEVIILPVIGKLPKAPENFVAGYKDPTTEIENSEYYEVTYAWDDKSNNEIYFEIEVLQYIGDAEDFSSINDGKGWASDESWSDFTTSITATNYKTAVYNSRGGTQTYNGVNVTTTKFDAADSTYVSGKLSKNNTTITVKYALGTRYIARIRSVNDNGTSAWVYVNLNPATPPTGTTAFGENVASINRYKITYNVKGGKWMDSSSDPATEVASANIPETILFKTQTNTAGTSPAVYGAITGETIMNPKKGETRSLCLTTSGTDNYFVRWILANDVIYPTYTEAVGITPASYTPENYKGYKNLSLFADYTASTTANVTEYNVKDYEILASMIKITALKSENSNAAEDISELSLTNRSVGSVDISTYTWLKFNLTTTTFDYDSVKVEIKDSSQTSIWTSDGETQDSSHIAEIKKDISSLTTGDYYIIFKGYTARRGNTPYTYLVHMEIVEGNS